MRIRTGKRRGRKESSAIQAENDLVRQYQLWFIESYTIHKRVKQTPNCKSDD